MTEFREILVLGLARSGSTLLSAILRNIDDNAGFYEILLKNKLHGLEDYPPILKRVGHALGAEAVEFDSPSMLAARDGDLMAFFDTLAEATKSEGYRSMSFKVFAKQISVANLKVLLRRPNLSVIFLTRKRIDRHISAIKAAITNRSKEVDTTELRPTLDVKKFLSSAFQQDRDLEAMYQAVVESGVRFSHLRYEADLNVDQTLRTECVTRVLRSLGPELAFTNSNNEGWLVKQDQTPAWRDKVGNGFEAAAALAGLGLLDYAEDAPLADVVLAWPARPAVAAPPRDDALLNEGGYNLAVSTDPVITLTAIQYGRSFMAEWMAGPEPVFGSRRGVHFLKPTWTMETTDLEPLAESLRRAEVCNPGHRFVAQHVSDREAQKYREVGIRSIPGNPNLFTNEAHFIGEATPHPGLPDSDTIYVARLVPWKHHELAAQLNAPLFIFGEPVDASERLQFDKLRGLFPAEGFVNHRLGQGKYHYLGRQELASVMARAKVALALSREEGCMRASVECLLAGLPIVSVPSIGGRELFFTPDTALIVEPTPEAVREGVAAMLARGLSRHEVQRATLERLREERRRFLYAANREIATTLGPLAPRLTMEPLLDYTIRYVPLRKMIEALK